MTIPNYQAFMRPLLEAVSDGQEHRVQDIVQSLADDFNIPQEERKELLPSGGQTVLTNRISWARTYLKQAGLLALPGRGIVVITDKGRDVLARAPSNIDVDYLSQFPEFREFQIRRRSAGVVTRSYGRSLVKSDENQRTPEEVLESAWKELREETAATLLQQIQQCSPTFFERLVVDLLVAMGYGGSRAEAGRSIGRSRDGGIDGTINEDKLGLDTVYIQAKRWRESVGRPEVQGFAGSLEGFRARKGVFITTSTFTGDARSYVSHIEKRIVLIDGAMLVELMLEYGVGVSAARLYTLHKIDLDYFDEG